MGITPKKGKNMYCTTCGKQIIDTARFCNFCGSPVVGMAFGAPTAPPQAPTRVQAAPVAPAYTEPVQPEIPPMPSYEETEQSEASAKLDSVEAPAELDNFETPNPEIPPYEQAVQPENNDQPEASAELYNSEISSPEIPPYQQAVQPENSTASVLPETAPDQVPPPVLNENAMRTFSAPAPNQIPINGEGSVHVAEIPEKPAKALPERKYTFGHIMMCLGAVAIMAIVAGVFAGLYFTVV